MNSKNLKKFLVDRNRTLRYTLKFINKYGNRFAIVVDKDSKLIGVIADGDIRRIILIKSLDTKVGEVCNKNPITVLPDTVEYEILNLFSENIDFIPVVNKENRLVDVYSRDTYKLNLPIGGVNRFRVKVPLRVSFSGGGTDISHFYNTSKGVVLSATINLFCRGTIERREDKKIFIYSNLLKNTLEYKDSSYLKYDNKLDFAKSVIKILKPKFGFNLFLDCDVPQGTGLGTSSALTVATIALINKIQGQILDLYQIAKIAYQAERVELKQLGGWQDQIAPAFGGVNFIEFTKDDIIVNPLRINSDTLAELEESLLLCSTNIYRNSANQTKSLLKKKHQKETQKGLDNVKEIAILMKNALLKDDIKIFSKLLDDTWKQKKRYDSNVTNRTINKMYDYAKRSGAKSAKLLGAGGGGYLLIFCEPNKKIILKEKLEKKYNTDVLNLSFNSDGLKVWPVANSE